MSPEYIFDVKTFKSEGFGVENPGLGVENLGLGVENANLSMVDRLAKILKRVQNRHGHIYIYVRVPG